VAVFLKDIPSFGYSEEVFPQHVPMALPTFARASFTITKQKWSIQSEIVYF